VSKTIGFDVCEIADVRKDGELFEIRRDDGWSFILEAKHGVEPKKGDKLEVYGDFGRPIQGICINGKTVYFKGELEMQREHEIWMEEARNEYAKEFAELMERIKDEPPYETIDMTGFGGGYEHACQKMLLAGVEYLKTKPDFIFDYKTFKDTFGIVWSDSQHAKELDKILLKAVGGDCSGAMHQCVIGHLEYICKFGRDNWIAKFDEDRRFMYPKGLPKPSLGKK
jgi:hypothetical protein